MALGRLVSGAARRFVAANFRASRAATRLISRLVDRTSGVDDFVDQVVPALLRRGLHALDVGGGAHPVITAGQVRDFDLTVVGLDISEAELDRAPKGCYAGRIVGDVASVTLTEQFDLVLSRMVLEHVWDTRRAMANLAAGMAPGATMAHLVPCRNAPFALLNRILGHRLGRRVLHAVYPERRSVAGFPAYYRLCTPSLMKGLCETCGLAVVDLKTYYDSDYFELLTPLYLADLVRQALLSFLRPPDFAETFCIVATRTREALPRGLLKAA